MLCTQTDNLSKTLQSTRITFIEGKALGDSVIKLLLMMRDDDQFDLFHKKVLDHRITVVGEPKLQRRRINRNCFQMKHNAWLDGLASASATFDHTEAIKHDRQFNFECAVTLVMNVKDRFDQKALLLIQDAEIFLLVA